MAIKLSLAAALLVALLALARATTITTTVTTASTDEEPNPSRRCIQQIQGRRFIACQRYLSQRGSPYGENEDLLETTGGRQQLMEECCQQLREVDRQGCGCEAIRHAMRQVQQGGSQQVYQKAQQLPRMCNLRDQRCQFHVVFL